MKKGISLIVLIVTIIVIIILAAAVILTLNKNNPIDSSRVSQLADNRASLNSAFQLYYGKKMAETQGIFKNEEIVLGGKGDLNGSFVAVPKIVGTQLGSSTYYKLTTKSGTNHIDEVATVTTGVANLNAVVPGVVITEKALDVDLPNVSKATWYMDATTGLVYLAYETKTDLPNWMFTDNRTTVDSTLNTFVRVVSNGNLQEYSKVTN